MNRTAAAVLAPAGLFYDKVADVLYVASTADNAILNRTVFGAAVPSAGTSKHCWRSLGDRDVYIE